MEAEVTKAVEPALTSTMQSLHNTSATLMPSPKDLFMMLPRMASRGAALLTENIPAAFEHLIGGPLTGRIVASATGSEQGGGALSAAAAAAGATAAGTVHETAAMAGEALLDTGNGPADFVHSFNMQQLRTFGGVFTYITSKWALGCLTAAIILNRTTIYASARRHIQLSWYTRLAARLVPIIMLLTLSLNLTRSMRCQTSPAFSEMRYGVSGKHSRLDYSGEGGTYYKISSRVLFAESDEDSCLAVGMLPTEEHPEQFPRGSLAMLWPSFQAFCTAQWVETLLCALQGRPVATETGMSLFEHSLAFAEAEALVSSMLGLSSWSSESSKDRNSQRAGGESKAKATSETTVLVTKSFIVSRFNTPPEVLSMALISALNHLSSQILGLFDKQAQYRLINTSIWGIAFMASFLWGFLNFTVEKGLHAGIFRFPTACIFGFVPHMLILLGIGLCAFIYSIALSITIASPPDGHPRNMSLRERFWAAHGNMQANVPLSGLRLSWNEDFYTALWRVGFKALDAASEAVFLNEGRRINVGHWTWLEEEHMEEIARLRAPTSQWVGGENVTNGVVLAEDAESSLPGERRWKSGYAREKSTKVLKGGQPASRMNGGVGTNQRGRRWTLAFVFCSQVFWLVTGWMALLLRKVLFGLGIQRCPGFLNSLTSAPPRAERVTTTSDNSGQPTELEFWMLSDGGDLYLPRSRDVDVEAETRKRQAQRVWGADQEKTLEQSLYQWWLQNGWWGEKDESGDYEEAVPFLGQEDDLTSVVSTTETEDSLNEWESDKSESGRRTPTQTDPFSRRPDTWHQTNSSSRAGTPFSPIYDMVEPPYEDTPLTPANLARLLDPPDPEARSEARMLAAHLSTAGIVTRSSYRNNAAIQGSSVLTSTRHRPAGFSQQNKDGPLSTREEAELLEWMIKTYRARKSGSSAVPPSGASNTGGTSWSEGGEGLGSGGPQCVVCQSSSRTILAWPCRCLSLCEECRVSLAMNNFATCVCCRQEVVGFSRLYVP
jgi:hypothetical protein